MPPSERFKLSFTVSKRNCWLWTEGVDSRGIPRFYIRKENSRPIYQVAARFAWLDIFGSLSEGEILQRTCKYKKCVNPDHHQKLTGGPNSKLTDYQRKELIELFTSKKLSAVVLAKEYGLTRQQVYYIVKQSKERT